VVSKYRDLVELSIDEKIWRRSTGDILVGNSDGVTEPLKRRNVMVEMSC
jgi:hypothetical protein